MGENKVQEIRDKQAELADRAVQWVMIGHLQSNKAKDIARLASEVQSLDRLSLAQALDRHLQTEQRSLDVLSTTTRNVAFRSLASERRALREALSKGLTNPSRLNRLVAVGVDNVQISNSLDAKDLLDLGRKGLRRRLQGAGGQVGALGRVRDEAARVEAGECGELIGAEGLTGPEAAKLAWDRTIEFFHRHLG